MCRLSSVTTSVGRREVERKLGASGDDGAWSSDGVADSSAGPSGDCMEGGSELSLSPLSLSSDVVVTEEKNPS